MLGSLLSGSLCLLLMGCHSVLSHSEPSASPLPVSLPSTSPPTPASQTASTTILDPRSQSLPITAQVLLKGKTFQLEVAETPDQQAMGLMYRPALPDDRGMLFPFEPARPVSFWMMNVPVALDMVFIAQGRVVAIAANVPPCAQQPCPFYGPPQAVDHVLELRSGRTKEIGLRVGEPVQIKHH
ncbi:MAG: DUF192 domain-containing protein [Synechococcales bacterium]|nr:DUF192 domain-containing protein [Synechococcales bacterium]